MNLKIKSTWIYVKFFFYFPKDYANVFLNITRFSHIITLSSRQDFLNVIFIISPTQENTFLILHKLFKWKHNKIRLKNIHVQSFKSKFCDYETLGYIKNLIITLLDE